MPGLYRDEGVVLRAIKLGEADRIVTIFTQGHGKVRAVAKGIRKTTSKFGARLEPTSRVALQCYKGRELDIVTQAETIDANRVLREEYALLTHAIPMLEAVDQVAQEREPNPALYRMLTGALHTLADDPQPARHARVLLEAALARGFPPDARRLRPVRRVRRRTTTASTSWSRSISTRAARCAGACARGGGRPVTPGGARAVAARARRRPQRRARRDAGPAAHEVEHLGIRALEHHVERRLRSTVAPLTVRVDPNTGRTGAGLVVWPRYGRGPGDPKLMDRVVNLAKRRGLVFPSSEIYGGFRSTWDYGPLGVLLKRNVKDAWWRSMVQLRDDIVGLDAAILMAPKVWEASGHLATFTDPLVDCRNCKERFRADHLPESGACPNCGAKDSFTEARHFNLMFKTLRRPGGGRRVGRVPAARDRAGHLRQLQERADDHAQEAAVRHRADRQVVPQRDHARQLHLPHARVRADGDGVLRAARRRREVVRVLGAGAVPLVRRARHPRGDAAHPPARPRRAVALLRRHRATSSSRTRGVGASSRASPTAPTSTSRSTPSSRARTSRTSTRSTTATTCPHVIEPAAGADRATLAFLLAAYHEEEVKGEKRTVLRLDRRLAPIPGRGAAAVAQREARAARRATSPPRSRRTS